MTFPPGSPPKKKVNYSNAWQEARALISARSGRLTLGLVLMLINRVAGLVLPATSKYLIDDVIGKRHAELLVPLAVAAGGATIVQAVTSFLLSQVLGVAAQRAITDMRRRVEAHVARLPVGYFDSTKSGVLISRIMTDAEGIRNLVGNGLVQLVGSIVTAVLALAYLFYLNWLLTCANIIALGTFGFAMATAFKRLRPLFRERGKINAEVTGRLNETLGGIRIVKTYTAEKREELVFARGVHKLFRNVAQSITGVSAITTFSTAIIGVIGMIIMIFGGRAILAGRMTIGDFLNYILFTGLLAAPVVQIASIGTQISEAFAGLDRIRELMQMSTEDEEDAKKAPLGEIAGEVTFEDVTFEYVPGTPVLEHVSFRAPAGTTTALVGSSGSGKSTLISMVMAFNRPLKGRIFVDGQDLASVRLRDYREQLGVVLQDNFLFDGTIADNIRYGKPDAALDDIKRVSRVAHADEFIETFEKGYDTIVGERGVKLSGGQRQRVSIARAILADPRILVLDEATSSLDSESEAMIQDGLKSLRQGRTTFVIAHRLSTIRSADQILVLEHGEIVERGSHAELIALGGRYRTLYDKQYKFESDRFVNPGEDFTPELAEAKIPSTLRANDAL
ncbi:MAG TPA: ABC transporter ATP-binding protein [Vicinamibacterales bacterium]|jgi:subfamily B ATP-binding cassette protein MsbA|nr:ABC transporter ATP-binding protein [Vicinamibacterales bacterium]